VAREPISSVPALSVADAFQCSISAEAYSAAGIARGVLRTKAKAKIQGEERADALTSFARD
jgi:hypothetical protein